MSYQTKKTLLEQVKNLLASYDAKLLEDTIKWAEDRVKAIQEYKMSDKAKDSSIPVSSRYNTLYGIAGGKSWYNIFDGRNWPMIVELIEKNHIAKTDKRNYKIVEKLFDSGVTDIANMTVRWHENGFDGLYLIECADGTRYVRINTVYAGGYNIQCAHLRVLVKVTKH